MTPPMKTGVGLLLLVWLVIVRAQAAELRDETRRAYEAYSTRATASFVQRVAAATAAASTTAGSGTAVAPAAQDGIIDVDGGLVHHWAGTSFIPGVTLDDALAVSVAYGDYPRMYKSVVASQQLQRDGDTYRLRFRIRESAMGRTIVLQVTSRVVYTFPRPGAVSSVANAEEIREVIDAGTPKEQLLPAGRDNGYLWRAATLTALVARTGGVAVAMETIALSRGFPPMLGWVIEPIARRLGRKSVELSLNEFAAAVVAHRKDAPLNSPRTPNAPR